MYYARTRNNDLECTESLHPRPDEVVHSSWRGACPHEATRVRLDCVVQFLEKAVYGGNGALVSSIAIELVVVRNKL